ncbi:hypothetical protein B4U80_09499 [Leptotrombidium deliense]|uniref:Uncharacterized protein n=1 Tax=Leptotrombidium deliense TaxID=299467 RepID=A0A443SNT7_9ACAR|nr:hypothetical protein B4U80_09499 [Leptotrombidium deliense]
MQRSRKIGSKCSFSSDCASGCCLLKREAKVRRCERKAVKGEKCSLAQVKADLYVDACPCVSGIDYCPLSTAICTK